MQHIYRKIRGIPYSQHKRRGNVDGLRVWTEAVVQQTQRLPRIRQACIAKITFLLPANKYPPNFPSGSDLDNLLKRFFDALNKTVFAEAPGKDSCVISLHVTKVRVKSDNKAGALLEILPVTL